MCHLSAKTLTAGVPTDKQVFVMLQAKAADQSDIVVTVEAALFINKVN